MIWLMALMVVFAPIQVEISAINVLEHAHGQKQHCQMDMADDMDHANMACSDMGRGDCCEHEGACKGNCSSGCTPHVSVHAMLLDATIIHNQPSEIFVCLKSSLANGIPLSSEYRPPRFFS